MSGTTRLGHGKIALSLHPLRDGTGRPLLLLHGLGQRSPTRVPADVSSWDGPVLALDFTGHGESDTPAGGGYHPEILMGDVDAAIAARGPVTLLGRGLGAYIAVLMIGARPEDVRGAILLDGPGMAGGGSRPGSQHIPWPRLDIPGPPDPFALLELTHDPRPVSYVAAFVYLAIQRSGLEQPISVCAMERPDWLAGILELPGVEPADLDEALALYGGVA